MKEKAVIKSEELERINSQLFNTSNLEDERRVGGDGYSKTSTATVTFSSDQADWNHDYDIDFLELEMNVT